MEASDSVLYDTFTHQLDCLYGQTNKVIGDCNRNMASITDYDLTFRPTRKHQDDTEYFDYAFKQKTLLDVKHTRRALWKAADMVHRQDCRDVLQGVKKSENSNTIALKFQIKGSSSTSLSEHIVVRRYDEENRSILVWRSLTEGNGTLRGMHSDKTGWCVLRPFEFGGIKETYVRQVPIYFTKTHDKQNISDFIILTHQANEEDGIAIAKALA
ncbi:hypothetical protein PHMEG_00022810 [Phytophthora megakarya]|uniref:Uncharacterized protein n=1 Tax=Phytophthora megakarya TaxID=4795 RepID=A0A225VIA5_9STRA|nr:hypothetical protein PHMEG_00022810 [Phytophthora megakarya]